MGKRGNLITKATSLHISILFLCLTTNMMIFVNINNFLKLKFIYIKIFSVAHWKSCDDSFFVCSSMYGGR
jgi:hypothetical protein